MLSDEEKKALEILDKFITEHKLFNIKHSDGLEEAIEKLLTAYEKEKEKNKELEKENKKLNILRLELLISQFPDTTETYKKYKKELDELLKEE